MDLASILGERLAKELGIISKDIPPNEDIINIESLTSNDPPNSDKKSYTSGDVPVKRKKREFKTAQKPEDIYYIDIETNKYRRKLPDFSENTSKPKKSDLKNQEKIKQKSARAEIKSILQDIEKKSKEEIEYKLKEDFDQNGKRNKLKLKSIKRHLPPELIQAFPFLGSPREKVNVIVQGSLSTDKQFEFLEKIIKK